MSQAAPSTEATRAQESAVSNQPDQPQPYAGTPPDPTPPDFPGQPTPQPPYGQNPYGTPAGRDGQPQFGQPQHNQPHYGQPQFGQPQHNQPHYGQPRDNQPQFAQPHYGQPQYGQPQFAQPDYAQPDYAQPQYGPPMHYLGGPGYVDSTSGPRGLSLSSMIIGLTSLFIAGWFIVPQIVGIVLGHIGLSRESPQGRPFSITGLVTNYLALLIYVGIYAFFIYLAASLTNYSTGTGDTWS